MLYEQRSFFHVLKHITSGNILHILSPLSLSQANKQNMYNPRQKHHLKMPFWAALFILNCHFYAIFKRKIEKS